MSIKTVSLIAIGIIVLGSIAGLFYFQTPAQIKKRESYPLSVVDDLGRNITIRAKPTRIVSLIPSASELVYAVGAGNLLVGVDQFSAYPDQLVRRVESGNLTIVGSGLNPDLDKVISLNPDIILISGQSSFNAKGVQRLLEFGYTIVSLDAQNIYGVFSNIELLGKVTGNSEQASKLSTSLRERISKVESAVKGSPKARVYVENWNDPLFSVGPGSIQDELINRVGGINVFSDLPKKSAQVSSEAVIAKNPEVIVLFHKITKIEEVKNRPGWNVIDAVKKNRVYYISEEENIAPYGAPGPRVVDGLEKIAVLIHPEIFKNQNKNPNILLMLKAN
ncbi:MAG: cobalamin-binding protein [Thaumarchaeota archaeon]|nr:cobalamin-binding protein [Nitrososphaerota archaeon]